MKTYCGSVQTLDHAVLLFEACRLGILSPLLRQLSSDEMQSSQSGSVYIWDELRVGMGQWTDGRSWQHELRGSLFISYEMEGLQPKIDGLVRKSWRVASRGKQLHLVSYYSSSEYELSRLQQPTDDPRLRGIVVNKSLYYKSSMSKIDTARACALVGARMALRLNRPSCTSTSLKMETYHGDVRTLDDAILLFQACEARTLPYLRRDLTETERKGIRPGSVFIWKERGADIRRWADGKTWRAFSHTKSFLKYKETESKGHRGFSDDRQVYGNAPESGTNTDGNQDIGKPEGKPFKKDGLVKQSLRVATSDGERFQLISYHSSSTDDTSKLQQPRNDPQLKSITVDDSLRSKFQVVKADRTLTPIDRKPKPLLAAPHASKDQYGYSRPYTAVDSQYKYKDHVFHCAPFAPQDYQPSASDLGSPHQKYDDAPVHAQSLSFHAVMADLHAGGIFTRAYESPHTQDRMPVAQSTTSGHTWSNCSQVGQVALPTIDSMSNAPIDVLVQAGIVPPGVSPALSGSLQSYVSIHDSNVAGGSRAPTFSTAQESSCEKYLRAVAQSAIDHLRYKSPCA